MKPDVQGVVFGASGRSASRNIHGHAGEESQETDAILFDLPGSVSLDDDQTFLAPWTETEATTDLGGDGAQFSDEWDTCQDVPYAERMATSPSRGKRRR